MNQETNWKMKINWAVVRVSAFLALVVGILLGVFVVRIYPSSFEAGTLYKIGFVLGALWVFLSTHNKIRILIGAPPTPWMKIGFRFLVGALICFFFSAKLPVTLPVAIFVLWVVILWTSVDIFSFYYTPKRK